MGRQAEIIPVAGSIQDQMKQSVWFQVISLLRYMYVRKYTRTAPATQPLEIEEGQSQVLYGKKYVGNGGETYKPPSMKMPITDSFWANGI